MNFRKQLLTAAAASALVVGLGTTASLAASIDLYPGHNNNGVLTLDPGGNPLIGVTGGGGSFYEDLNISSTSSSHGAGTNQSFSGDLLIDIGSFNVGSTIGPAWNLFAVVQVAGTGNWSSGDFTATSITTANLQLYGVQGNPPPGNQTFINSLTDPNSHTLSVGTNTAMSSNNMGNFGLPNDSLNTIIGNSNQYHNNSANACDVSSALTAPTHYTATNNCMLLAWSTNLNASDLLKTIGTGDNDDQEFSLISDLTLNPKAEGANGFFGSDNPNNMVLTINSGEHSLGWVDVTDGNESHSFTYNTCNSDGYEQTCGDAVNWDITDPSGVPEPASMAVFGTGLLGLGAMIRRRRKA
jgi:hypothetical protein